MFFFSITGQPVPGSVDSSEFSGAFIKCWVQRDTRSEAEDVARIVVQDEGWEIVRMEEGLEVAKADYQKNTEDQEFFEQALIDKIVVVFDTWGKEEN